MHPQLADRKPTRLPCETFQRDPWKQPHFSRPDRFAIIDKTTQIMVDIFIDSWFVWQSRSNGTALCQSCKRGQQDESEVEKPHLPGISAMQRRRLGPLARVVFHALEQCADVSQQEPVIFCSLMGEIQRTQGLLTAIASDRPVSPAAFSLSVHNAISGLWSLNHDIKAPMISLSPSTDNTVMAGLLEAAGILREKKYPAVNIIHYEEAYPPFYTPFLKQPRMAPCALALRVATPETAKPHAQKLTLEIPASRQGGASFSDPLSLVPLLTGACSALELAGHHTTWRLECHS